MSNSAMTLGLITLPCPQNWHLLTLSTGSQCVDVLEVLAAALRLTSHIFS